MDRTLCDAEVLALAARGELPSRWRTMLTSRALRPTFAPGTVLQLSRRRAVSGDIICLVCNGRLVWRRVLAVRDDELLLRREIGPFPDGWFSGALACVDSGALLHRLAAQFPGAWTQAAWWSAWVMSSSFNLPRFVGVKLTPRLAFTTRLLDAADATALRALYAGAALPAPSLPPSGATLGLFNDATLVGSAYLDLSQETALCSSLYVAPAMRGRGGAIVLLRAVVAEARRRGVTALTCHVAFRNFASRAAFRRVGFVATGRWYGMAQDPFMATEEQLLELSCSLG